MWGFYNGVSANKDLLPSSWYYPGNKGSERFSLYKLGSEHKAEWEYKGANRLPNIAYATANILTAVVYPEGGKTEFVYETGKFSYLGAVRNGGGVRIKSIKKYDQMYSQTPVLEHHFTYSTGKVINMPVFGYFKGLSDRQRHFRLFSVSQTQPATTHGGFVGYETVTVREGSATGGYGETVYTYHLPATYKVETDGLYKASKTYVVGKNVGSDLSNITGLNVFPFPPHPDYDWNRGQLLSEKVYDGQKKLKRETTYKYRYYYPGGCNEPAGGTWFKVFFRLADL